MAESAGIVESLWYSKGGMRRTGGRSRTERDRDRDVFENQLRGIGALRPFSSVVSRVIELLADPDFSVGHVRQAIEEDPALATRVLTVANSAAYASISPCASVQQAIVRLGADTVRELLISLSVMSVFRDVLGWGRHLRDHCAATGAVARLLGQAIPHGQPPGSVLLAGLMHDLGKLLLLQDDRFPPREMELEHLELLSTADGSHELERRHLGFDHAVLGGHAASMWRLPSPIPETIAWHHRQDDVYATKDGRLARTVALVRIADQLDRHLSEDPPQNAAAVVAIGEGPDAAHLGVSPDIILDAWSLLHFARAEACSLFS